MSLTTYGANLLRELLPAARKGAARGAGAKADRRAAAKLAKELATKDGLAKGAIAKDLAAFDAQIIAGLSRRDAVAHLAALDEALRKANPEALAQKYANMAKSPRRFLTGQPALMAHDMRDMAANLGADTVLQGDLHLHNFGTVVKRNGKLKIRPIDFDEATIGPAAFDLNRLATHVVLTGRENELGARRTQKLVEALGESYHDTLAALAKGKQIKVKSPEALDKLLKDAAERDAKAWIERHAPKQQGKRLLERNVERTAVSKQQLATLSKAFEGYRQGLPPETARQLEGYRVTDAVAVLSGTGSVGRPRFRLLLEGGKGSEPIILQLKAQEQAALERVAPTGRRFGSPAERSLAIGDVLDGGLDGFRGVAKTPGGPEFLVERVRASDATLHVEELTDAHTFEEVVGFYAAQTAKGHARGAEVGLANAQAILDTLGPKQSFVDALVAFAHSYADQVERDYQAFTRALKRDPLLARVGAVGK